MWISFKLKKLEKSSKLQFFCSRQVLKEYREELKTQEFVKQVCPTLILTLWVRLPLIFKCRLGPLYDLHIKYSKKSLYNSNSTSKNLTKSSMLWMYLTFFSKPSILDLQDWNPRSSNDSYLLFPFKTHLSWSSASYYDLQGFHRSKNLVCKTHCTKIPQLWLRWKPN